MHLKIGPYERAADHPPDRVPTIRCDQADFRPIIFSVCGRPQPRAKVIEDWVLVTHVARFFFMDDRCGNDMSLSSRASARDPPQLGAGQLTLLDLNCMLSQA